MSDSSKPVNFVVLPNLPHATLPTKKDVLMIVVNLSGSTDCSSLDAKWVSDQKFKIEWDQTSGVTRAASYISDLLIDAYGRHIDNVFTNTTQSQLQHYLNKMF